MLKVCFYVFSIHLERLKTVYLYGHIGFEEGFIPRNDSGISQGGTGTRDGTPLVTRHTHINEVQSNSQDLYPSSDTCKTQIKENESYDKNPE